MPENTETEVFVETYLNCAKGFWDIYRERPGAPRRTKLLALFKRHPSARIPVNNRYQANMKDADLRYLMKKGILLRTRDGGTPHNHLNRSSHKRQSWLVLAKELASPVSP
jgi:hypothetical protein